MKILQFIKKWLVPEGFLVSYRHLRTPKYKKFWAGSPVAANPLEHAYFSAHGIKSHTITRLDDSRQCGYIAKNVCLNIPMQTNHSALQFAITACAAWSPEACVTITAPSFALKLTGLSAQQWLDVRCELPIGTQQLEIKTDQPIYLSYPRPVKLAAEANSPSSAQHVIVLVLDGWSNYLLETYHPTQKNTLLTPNINRFFENAYRANHGYSAAEWTMPTVASMFTGQYASRHQVFHPTADVVLPKQTKLLAEYFQAAGYHTLGMSTANRVTPAYGYHRGFDQFIYHWPHAGRTARDYDPGVWINQLIGHLAIHQCDKTFSYLHFPDTHPAWDIGPLTRSFNLARRENSSGVMLQQLAGSDSANAFGKQLLQLRLHELDRLLGALFYYIEQNIASQTLVVLTADHGTPWKYFRPQRPGDEPVLVDDRTLIPIYIKGERVAKKNYTGLVSPNLDLLPTLLDYCDIKSTALQDGKNLLADDYAYSATISESIYQGVYEIAVRDSVHSYFEKYHYNESKHTITDMPFYRNCFMTGTSNYMQPFSEDHACHRAYIARHVVNMGLTNDQARAN